MDGCGLSALFNSLDPLLTDPSQFTVQHILDRLLWFNAMTADDIIWADAVFLANLFTIRLTGGDQTARTVQSEQKKSILKRSIAIKHTSKRVGALTQLQDRLGVCSQSHA